jgi:cell division protein FtsQ
VPSDPRRPHTPTGRPTTRRASSGSKPTPNRPGPSHRRLRIADVRRIRRQVLFSLYVVLAGETVAAALTTPLLHIRQIEVSGAESLPPAEIANVLAAAKLPNGTNFLLAPVNREQARVRALPWVRSATVHRHFPYSVTVAMTLREPVAQVQTTNGIWEVDSAGLPIRSVRSEMASRLPMIVWQQPTVVKPGTVFGDKTLQSALEVSRWAQKETAVHLAKIEVDQSDNICLNMKDGIPIKFGPDSELESKQTLVVNLYRRDPDIAQRIQQIDVSCPSDVACTPRVILPTPASNTLQPGDTVVNRP